MQFDFIIVGAGSAGCVLANRLSASGRHKVLLLEAGGSDHRFYVKMPLGYGKTFYDPQVNWLYRAKPDAGLNGQSDFWPRGKVLGGSSSINAMVYIRGAREDYDIWQAAGGAAWGWAEVLKAYQQIEDNEAGPAPYRGVGGPLHVSANRKGLHPLYHSYVAAAQAAGLPYNPDFNGESQFGVGHYQLTTKKGRRVSSATAFLAPARGRKNLHIETRALVSRVLFDGRRAVGVEFVQHGKTRQVLAACEVILSGGAINSVQLLQLSGIGPQQVLAKCGIAPLVVNEHVGRNLEDHQGINYTYRMKVRTLNDELRPWWGKVKAGLQYLLLGQGPLSQSINQGGGFFRTSPAHVLPNMQLYMQAFSTLIPREGERPILNPDPFSGMSIGLSNCRPRSRGEIAIASADPNRAPDITPNAFSVAEDVEEMLAAVKFVRNIAAQQPLADLIAEELRPGPACVSDAALIDDFRQRSGTVYHPSCTCRMGADAASSVVDANLRVHGTAGLRVCDASVFPSLIGGNTNAPAIMVGWRGADILLEEYHV